LPVIVGEGDAMPNLFYIRRRVKVVRVGEFPTALLGQ
jgi:hypothetical protein